MLRKRHLLKKLYGSLFLSRYYKHMALNECFIDDNLYRSARQFDLIS